MSGFQEKGSSRSCKTPRNHHHYHHHHHRFCSPCRRSKKLTLIVPSNNDKCPGGRIFPPNHISHQHDARPWNGCPQRPWLNFGDKYGTTIFPTGVQAVSYGSLNWQTGNSEMFPWGLCLPFQPSHSVCCTRLSPWFNLPVTTAYIVPKSITLKTAAIHPMSSILSLPQKTSPPVTQSCLLPPPWLSRSQAAAAKPRPPPLTSRGIPAGTTPGAMTPATFTPLGLTTGKATGQAIGHQPDSYIDGPSNDLSNPHSPGLDPWQSNGSIGEGEISCLGIYDHKMDNGQVSQGSSSSASSKG